MLFSARSGPGLLLRPQQCLRVGTFRRHTSFQRLISHARGRRQHSEENDVPEQQPEQAQQPDEKPAIVRSSRGSASSRRTLRDTRSTAQKLVTPHQALREMGIIALNDEG